MTMKHAVWICMLFFLLIPGVCLSETIILGTPDNVPPFSYQSDGATIGIDIDISREIFQRLDGYELEIRTFPWKRLINNIEEGQIQGILSIHPLNKYRKMMYMVPEPLYISEFAVFVRKNKGIRIERLSDLSGRRVGTIVGYQYSSDFQKISMDKVECNDDRKLVQMFLKERFDIAVAEKVTFMYFADKAGLKDIEKQLIMTQDHMHMGISKNMGEKGKKLSEAIGDVVSQMKKDNLIDEIQKKYQ